MITIDLNCDMGEGIGNDELIMPFISSANIACGFHAGNEDTIRQTIQLAIEHNVAIGAHISFPDRENFGRKEMDLSNEKLIEIIEQQLQLIKKIAGSLGAKLKHVKPHGALYNMSAKDPAMASSIAKAIHRFDRELILFGPSGSVSIHEAELLGLQTANEVFADRTYQDDGSLTPRTQSNALIEDSDKAMRQVLEMVNNSSVTAVSGRTIPIKADTICIHGDGKHAVEFAKNIYTNLKQQSIVIKAC